MDGSKREVFQEKWSDSFSYLFNNEFNIKFNFHFRKLENVEDSLELYSLYSDIRPGNNVHFAKENWI